MLLNILMTLGGLFLIGWGFYASQNMKRPVDVIGAFVTIAGLVLAVVGTLLICVPGFFAGGA